MQRGHVVTAAHVINKDHALSDFDLWLTQRKQHIDRQSLKAVSLEISFPTPSVQRDNLGGLYYANTVGFSAKVLVEDDATDLAILVCDHNPVGRNVGSMFNSGLSSVVSVPALQVVVPKEGESISVSGFPLSIPVLVTNTGTLATSFFIDEHGRSLYLASLLVNHGNSGGPAYLDSTASVIGVVVEYRPAPEGNSGLTVIVPISRVLDLISKVKE